MSKNEKVAQTLEAIKALLVMDARDAKTESGDLIMSWNEFQGSIRMYVRIALAKEVDKDTVNVLYQAGKEAGHWNCSKPSADKETAIFIHVKPRQEVNVEEALNKLF